jgi:endonuclease/exonuclease/phosphatase family metal-dependent hydrolase
MMQRLSQTAVLLFALVPATQLSAQPVNSLRIMTFNVWTAEGTPAGRDKLREIMLAGGADIIGVQELDDSAGRSIAAAMGFHYHQQSGGDIQVISRYPIVMNSPSNFGVAIAVSPNLNIWLFNSHLAAYPYQPYDLQDGVLPRNENAVIAAANSARGGQVTTYLNDMAGALASDMPVFFTGDFNEPSFLDWTTEAANASPRTFDLKVEYPASKRIVDAGMMDSFRAIRPDEVTDTAYTWTPGYPYPTLSSTEVHDRIDIIYHAGTGVTATGAFNVGPLDGNPNTHFAVAGFNADHRAVVVDYDITSCSPWIDLNNDCSLDSSDWSMFRAGQFRDMTGLTPAQAYAMGDLNGDFRNNHDDFVIFKHLFEAAHGANAFAALFAEVPEPSAIVLAILLVVLVLVPAFRRRTVNGGCEHPPYLKTRWSLS